LVFAVRMMAVNMAAVAAWLKVYGAAHGFGPGGGRATDGHPLLAGEPGPTDFEEFPAAADGPEPGGGAHWAELGPPG
jgi:hypothetical protein